MLTSPLRVMECGSNVSFGLNDSVLAIDTHESPFQKYTVPTVLGIQTLMTIIQGRYDFLHIVKEAVQRLSNFPTIA